MIHHLYNIFYLFIIGIYHLFIIVVCLLFIVYYLSIINIISQVYLK